MSHILQWRAAVGVGEARYRVTEPAESKQTDDSLEDEEIDTDYADLIAAFGAPDPDDEEVLELDPGVNFELPSDVSLSADDDAEETPFTGEYVFPESLAWDLAEDAPVDNLGFDTIELPHAGDLNDDESELPLDTLLDGELPPMDADPNDEPSSELFALELNAGVERRVVNWADRRYVEVPGGYALEPCSALSGNERTLYAAGKTLFKISLDRSTSTDPACETIQLAELRHSALSLIPLPLDDLLCVTTAGQLLLIDRNGGIRSLTEQLTALAQDTFRRVAVQLTQHGGSVRLLLSDGALAKSDDGGSTFQIEQGIPSIVQLATGPEQIALARNRDRPLWKYGDGAWRELGAASIVLKQFLTAASDTSVLFAAAGDIILVGKVQRGLLLSTDGGLHFEFLAGSTGVTALWADRVAGQPAVFLTTHRSVEGLTDLMKVDLAENELQRLLEVPSTEPRDPNGDFDGSSEDEDGVLGIHYEAQTQTLWLAGGFGLRRFSREPVQ